MGLNNKLHKLKVERGVKFISIFLCHSVVLVFSNYLFKSHGFASPNFDQHQKTDNHQAETYCLLTISNKNYTITF